MVAFYSVKRNYTIMKILLANPRGFCAGVDRAIEIVELAIKKYGAPVYVRHEIVHNKFVVDDLRAKGAVFVNEINEIPDGAVTVFSAHGVSEKVENSAKLRDLPVIDATCPLVTKVHTEAQRYESEGREIILIGHKGHPEVEGTSGRVQKVQLVENVADVAELVVDNPDNLAYVTQTTLSLDDTKIIIEALKARFPNIDGPDTRDICYATQNRQNAVRELAKHADVMLVIGASNSSNSNRLRDLGEEIGVNSYLIDNAEAINPVWLNGANTIAVTAGASAPEILVQRVIDRLRELGANSVEEFAGKKENVKFKLPEQVRDVL